MKKIAFLLTIFFLFVAVPVFAYGGNHNFLNMSTVTSDGHSYKSEFLSSGSFPFNGKGAFDRSKVSLRGTLNVYEKDGAVVNESYCVVLSGNLKSTSGKLIAETYSDTTCKILSGKKMFTVSQYSEEILGRFSLTAKDEAGIVYTISGDHVFF